ncbi:MAG: hypothetical protein FWG77_08250 [Treponema sp.]|nr:hypothetical protein [Treponema sp.]
MKVCAIQPKYPHKQEESDECILFFLDTLDQCDESIDLILFPEGCNAPSYYHSMKDVQSHAEKYTEPLLNKVRETAIRCKSIVAINLNDGLDGLYRNTTIVFGWDGQIKGKYLKQHNLPQINTEMQRDDSYSYAYKRPYSIEIDGIKYGFLTCYDGYFNEYIAHLTTQNLDIILFPTHQRAERMDILEMEAKNIAFNCNAYVIRSSVSMGDETHLLGGSTMVVAPDGKVIENYGQKVGALSCIIDPKKKYERSGGFNRSAMRNEKYIEQGRKPWAYRACGPGVIRSDRELPYPRVCSHRGFNTIAPENSQVAFGAAVALGADELEMDIRFTKDRRQIICHDDSVDRLTAGTGRISDLNWEEIKHLSIGGKSAPEFTSLGFVLFEQVLQKFARRAVINLHIKSGEAEEYNNDDFHRIVQTIYEYDCQEHVYIAGREDVLRTAIKLAPELPRCVLDEKKDFKLVELAKRYKCSKLQFVRGKDRDYFNQEMIDEANAAGIRCNLFWSDNPAEAVDFLKRGIDTILTNDFLRVASAVWDYRDRIWEKQKEKIRRVFGS